MGTWQERKQFREKMLREIEEDLDRDLVGSWGWEDQNTRSWATSLGTQLARAVMYSYLAEERWRADDGQFAIKDYAPEEDPPSAGIIGQVIRSKIALAVHSAASDLNQLRREVRLLKDYVGFLEQQLTQLSAQVEEIHKA